MPVLELASDQLWGQGNPGSPAVFARAAVLEEDATGRATLSGDLLSLAFQRMKRGEGDMDLVLVAEDAGSALLMRLPPGLILVGVVAEREMTGPLPEGSKIAVVGGVGGAREAIPEGSLLIVDPVRGSVLIEPGAEQFAQLQMQRDRPRVILGTSHLPAQTMAGRTVAVWAAVGTAGDLKTALEQGADGLLVAGGGDLMPLDESSDDDQTSEEMRRSMSALADAVGGGDILLAVSPEMLDPLVVVQLAAHTRLRWAIAPGALPISPEEFRTEMSALIQENQSLLRLAELPLLVADVNNLEGFDPAGWDELLLTHAAATALTLAETFGLPPIRARIETDGMDGLPEAVGIAAGLIVPPESVKFAKELIRAQEY